MYTLIRTYLFSAIFSSLLFMGGCTSDSGVNDNNPFDRAGMLENYATQSIIPSYNTLESSVLELESAAATFESDPSETTLANLQSSLKDARLAWQDASMFQFGPAESVVLRTALNTYPSDTLQIKSNIESGEYTLGTLENRAAAGFPALGYLLHGIGTTEQEIISEYTVEDHAANRMKYLQDVVAYVKDNVESVANEWNPGGGDYVATFLSEDNAGNDVGSSMGMLINSLVLHYERFLRDGKIGIPSGVRSAGVPRPTATEAFYGGYSVELAVANLEAVRRLYRGTGLENQDGLGLEQNLEALDAQDLSAEILTEMNEAISTLEGLNDPLSETIESNNDPVLTAFQELQDVVVLLKADMTSVLGITITYQDNDGD